MRRGDHLVALGDHLEAAADAAAAEALEACSVAFATVRSVLGAGDGAGRVTVRDSAPQVVRDGETVTVPRPAGYPWRAGAGHPHDPGGAEAVTGWAGGCSVCTHAERSAIDRALATGAGKYRNISERYGVSIAALSRHAAAHLPLHLARAEDAAEAAAPAPSWSAWSIMRRA